MVKKLPKRLPSSRIGQRIKKKHVTIITKVVIMVILVIVILVIGIIILMVMVIKITK